MRVSRETLIGLSLTLFFTIVIGTVIFNNYILIRGPMYWDEAEHIMTATIFASDIVHLDFISLANHSYQQLLWPPAHPIYLSLLFVFFGPSVILGRISSLMLFFAFSISLYYVGRVMVKKDKHVAGILCASFGLVTYSIYLVASETMLETMALLFFTLAILSFLYFLQYQKGKRKYLIPLFTLLTFFSKTNYGIIMILSILAYFLFQHKLSLHGFLKDRNFIRIFMPIVLIVLTWLLFPPDRLLTFLGFLINRPEGANPMTIEAIMYYPYELFIYSGPLLLVYLVTFLFSFKNMKYHNVRYLIIIIILTILLNFFHQNKKIRYILYIYPPLFALASLQITRLYSWVNKRWKQTIFILLMVVLLSAFTFHASLNLRFYNDNYSVEEPLDFIKQNTIGDEHVFLLGEFSEFSPGLVTWHLSTLDGIKDVKASAYYISEFAELEGALAVPGEDDVDQEAFSVFIDKHKFDAIVIIELDNDTKYYNSLDYQDYCLWKTYYIPIVMSNEGYVMENMGYFEDLGMTISILRKTNLGS